MTDQPKEPEKVENAKQPEQSEKPPKKVWKTPRVILATVRNSEAKGPPLPEVSLSSSPADGTPNS